MKLCSNLLVLSLACLPWLTAGAMNGGVVPVEEKYSIKVEPVDYVDTSDNDFALRGYVSIPDSDTPVPGVVIIVSSI
jgi:hypothetical protein